MRRGLRWAIDTLEHCPEEPTRAQKALMYVVMTGLLVVVLFGGARPADTPDTSLSPAPTTSTATAR